jgi:NAD(P) transhydrogenase subunit alpha
MKIFVAKEIHPGETRTPMTPDTVEHLKNKHEIPIIVESGIGSTCKYTDEDYEKAGATVSSDRGESLSSADVVIRLRKPPQEEIAQLKKGAIHISFLDPFNEPALIDEMVKYGVTGISMEMIPRTTLAQKMDALSSQANLAGYVAVVLGADRMDKVLPMMMTPAGTIAPSRVFIIGVGVAGLQAIATAKRLGARVDAFDTRPVVEEQVKSLGAKFVKVDLGETGQTKDGYAKELTREQQEKQREAMAKVCAQSDLVITTAQLFGRKAPVIVTKAMVDKMKPGSVLVDLAVESGGNVEGSEVDKEVDVNGVRIIGLGNLPGRVAVHASQMYSANMSNFLETYWSNENKKLELDWDDEIIQGCVITHDGEIRNEMIKKLRNQ